MITVCVSYLLDMEMYTLTSLLKQELWKISLALYVVNPFLFHF